MTETAIAPVEKTDAMHEVLRQIPYGLYAVGVGDSTDIENAFVASWVMQCSFDPPMLALAVRRDSASAALLREHRAFSLNLLGRDQEEIAHQLVPPRHRVGDKLGPISQTVEVTGAPILRDALGFVECRVAELTETGDHLLAIGEVVNAGQNSSDIPLTCADLGWHYGG